MTREEDDFNYATIELRTDGPLAVLKYHRLEELDLKYLQSVTLGHISIVNMWILPQQMGYRMVVNDDACYMPNLKINPIASLLYGSQILGDVVVGIQRGPDQGYEPDIYALPVEEARKLKDIILANYYSVVGND